MLDLDFLPPPTVLVLGAKNSLADSAAQHLKANFSAVVVNCGTNAHRAALTLGSEYVDAVLVLRESEDEFGNDLELLIDRASNLACPILLHGVSEKKKRRLEDEGPRALHVLAKEASLERIGEELERMTGVKREEDLST